MLVKLSKFLDNNKDLNEHEIFFGKLAVSLALESKDVTKVGAIIFKGDRVISNGFNLLSEGVSRHAIEITENNKLLYTIHAEMYAITNCAKLGNATYGASMLVVGKFPCCDCARAIIAAGIIEVICPPMDSNSRWVESNKIALSLFEMANVTVRTVKELTGMEFGLTCPSKYIV